MTDMQKLFLTFKKKGQATEYFGFIRMSGTRSNKLLNNLIKEHNIEYVGWEDIYDRMIYSKNPKKCKHCGNLITFERKDGQFCSSSCRASFSNTGRKKSNKTKDKIRQSIKISSKYKEWKENRFNNPLIHKCDQCGSEYDQKTRSKSKFCSDECYHTRMSMRSRKVALNRIKNGTHNGWSSRNTLSYPEKFFKKVLELNGFTGKFEINYPVNKRKLGLNSSTNYFLDFYFPHLNLDLEIDGKQHNYKDRKISDFKRDQLLEKVGYKIYRIEWKAINNDDGRLYIKDEIKKLLDFLKTQE